MEICVSDAVASRVLVYALAALGSSTSGRHVAVNVSLDLDPVPERLYPSLTDVAAAAGGSSSPAAEEHLGLLACVDALCAKAGVWDLVQPTAASASASAPASA